MSAAFFGKAIPVADRAAANSFPADLSPEFGDRPDQYLVHRSRHPENRELRRRAAITLSRASDAIFEACIGAKRQAVIAGVPRSK
jgi:hypothetical protein